MDIDISGEVLRWQEKLFKFSVRRQEKTKQIKKLLGISSGLRCLEVCPGDGMISRQLRTSGGEWVSCVPDAQAKDAMKWFIKDKVKMIKKDGTISEPDESFDVVVVVDMLERVDDALAFIKECHRVLKSNGRLIITTHRKMRFSPFVHLASLMFGLSWRRRGYACAGYTQSEFFDVLKDGFDVPATNSYSSCLLEFPGVIAEGAANKISGGPYNMPPADSDTAQFYHYTTMYTFAILTYPWMWLMSKLDKLFAGHNIVATTKRRSWRERRVPQLIDGRSIAEAALNTKIGTASIIQNELDK